MESPLGSYFGITALVTGNWIVVGAPWDDEFNVVDTGSVFVFSKSSSSSSSSTWTRTACLLFAADGVPGDEFGITVALSKDASTMVVGTISMTVSQIQAPCIYFK
jgi:hypothetical protein